MSSVFSSPSSPSLRAARRDFDEVDAEALDDPCPAAGFEQYLSLYSPRFHRESGPVVARLEECLPTRLREEIAEAAVLGIPGLFWVFVSAQLIEYGRQTGRM